MKKGGRGKMALERIDHFMRELRQVNSAKERKKLCLEEIQYLKNSTDSPAVIRSILTKYRNEIRKYPNLEDALKFLRLSKIENMKVNQITQRNTVKANKSLRELNLVDYIFKCEKLIDQPEYSKVMLGLCGLTGRRPYEIGVSGNFKKVKKSKNHDPVIIFSGQAKKKGSEREVNHPYEIPLLTKNIDHLIERFNFFKSITCFPSVHEKFHNKISSPLNRMIKKEFEGIIKNPKPKDLRAGYAEICFSLYAENDISKPAYFSEILGHDPDDITTAISYNRFNLIC